MHKSDWLIATALLLLGSQGAGADLAGSYVGDSGGDPVQLQVQQQGTRLSGVMADSQQSYAFEATLSGDTLVGTATESSLGVVFAVSGTASEAALDLTLTLEVQGQRAEQALHLVRTQTSASAPAADTALPSGANRDPNLVGRWVHESQYQSGSGDSYFAGSSSQAIVFLRDGGVADGGSSVSVSGNDYFGNSDGNASTAAAPNVRWHTQNQHVYLVGSENGQTQSVDLGRYFIEDGHLLLTGNNGKRMLFSRQQ